MEPYQERVVAEKRELDEKLSKLANFLFSDQDKRLVAVLEVMGDEHLRLLKQYCHMMDYSKILGERIAAFRPGVSVSATTPMPIPATQSEVKLDKKFYGVIRKAKDDSIVPSDQWVLFLAKDNAFAAILPNYYDECVELGCDAEQLDRVSQMIANVGIWRSMNPDKLKNPDAAGEKLLP